MSGPLATFKRFPEFPLELRRKIWQEAIYDGTNIVEPRRVEEHGLGCPTTYSIRCEIPPLLLACRESREESLLRYQQIPLPHGADNHLEAAIYINPSTDILYLNHEIFSSRLGIFFWPGHPGQLRKANVRIETRRIAICASGAGYRINSLVLDFKGLEEIILIGNDEDMETAELLRYRLEAHWTRRRFSDELCLRPAFKVMTMKSLRPEMVDAGPDMGHNIDFIQCDKCHCALS